MSAFTPYKRHQGRTASGGDLPRFPPDLTAFLLAVPQYRARLTIPRCPSPGPEREEAAKRKRNEGFLMKNLLRRDDHDSVDERRLAEETRRLDDHASRVETIVSNLGKSDGGHRCIYCGKLYSRKYGLKIHVRTHTGYKPLKCKYCSRPFGDPSNLNKHVRLHAQGTTPYKCQFCDKLLVRRRDLERHIKSRHTNLT